MNAPSGCGKMHAFSIPAVDKRHASEACYLAETRRDLLRRIDRDFADLCRHDRQLERHVYALSVSANRLADAMDREVRLNSRGRLYVELSVALRVNDEEVVTTLLRQCTESLGPGEEANPRDAALAFGTQLVDPGVQSRLMTLWRETDQTARQIAFDAVTCGAGNLGGMLQDALASADSLLRARAYRVLGRTGTEKDRSVLRAALASENGDCRFWAAWSCVILGDSVEPAVAELAEHLTTHDPSGWHALCSLMCGLPLSRSFTIVQALMRDETRWPIAATAMGLSGDPRFVPWLVEKLEYPELARPCMMSLTMILGIDPTTYSNRIRKREPSRCEWLDQRLSDWPMPDVLGIRQYWQEHAATFKPGDRYWLGSQAEPARVAAVLFAGPLFFRPIAALISTCLKRPNRVFPTSAAAAAQSRLLCHDPAT